MKNHGIRKRCIHARDSISQSGLFLGPGDQGTLLFTPDNNQVQAQQQQAQSPIQYTYSSSSQLASSSSSTLSLSVSSSAPLTSGSPSSTWSTTLPPTSTTSVGTSSLVNSASSVSPNATTTTSSSTTTIGGSTSSTIESISSSTPGSTLSATQPITVVVPSSAAAVSNSTSPADPSQAESNVPIYVGIGLGIIVVIAFLAALVAWSVRLHRHRKRNRNTLTNVPWAKSRDDELPSKLESGTSTPDDVSFNTLHTWEPRGDRDVGEPKRSESYFYAKAPVVAVRPIYATPPPQLPPLPHVMPLQDSMVYTPPQYPTIARTFPMVDNYGTPRQAAERPRYLSLGGDGMGLAVPWRHSPPPPPPIAVQTLPPQPSVPVGPALPSPLPCPCPSESRIRQHHRESKECKQEEKKEEQDDGWTASVRSSLVSAFNAVAASLPNRHQLSLTDGEAEDNLTTVPKRRLDRKMSNASTTSSTTLEGFDHALSPLPEDTSNKGSELGMTSAPLVPQRYRRYSRRKGEGVVSRSTTLTSASSAPWRKKSVLSYSGSMRSRFSTMSELSESEEFARKLLCARLSAS